MFFLLYGPILTTLCIYGFTEVRSLSRICTMHGISGHSNYVNLFVLVVAAIFSISVTVMMAMEKTMDIASIAFTNESSIIYRLSTMYFQYSTNLRNARTRDRLRQRRFDRDERRADQETARSLEDMMLRQRELEDQQALIVKNEVAYFGPNGVKNNYDDLAGDDIDEEYMLSTEEQLEARDYVQTLGNS